MDTKTKNNILIIGGPNAGKTHFGGQLYGRLNNRNFNLKIDPNYRPNDLTIFQDVLNKLYEGKRADHTEASANRGIELKVYDKSGTSIIFTFPDYAGEQVKAIVKNRKVNSTWKKYIEKSNSWILFIRLDEILPIEDIINRGIPSADEIQRRNAKAPPVEMSMDAYFIELLQILLYLKASPSLNRIKSPNLTIVLSCWDLLNLPEKTIPREVLIDRLPLLYHFVKNTWEESCQLIIGLSSTEKSLTDVPDEEYIDRTPVNFGYYVDEKGKKEKDLTLSIPLLIENK